nr:ATP-binding protein [Roseicella aerolata]
MRNTYYRHTGTALDELVDNAIEAGAKRVHVALGYDGKSDAKPDAIAIIDDGHGMVREMIRLSVLWGGTHREGSRAGFGRFGFGLPSASVNQARRFSVYSITENGGWHGITVDLDDIREGKYTDQNGKVVAPPVSEMQPPKWVFEYISEHHTGNFTHGTIVLWEKVDRLKWKTTSAMKKNLLEHFGITYRNYLDRVSIFFDGTKVEPTDPLFTTPGFRYFDLDEDRATALEPTKFDVTVKSTGEKARVVVRYARFPVTFHSVDKSKAAVRGNQNPRFAIANENRGLIITRMGRQIDVVDHTPWDGFERFLNNDRYWAAEIDFPAELDEEFTIANSKQGVVLSDRFWDLLEDAGVLNAIKSLRRSVGEDGKAREHEKETGKKRISEQSMKESEKFRRKRAGTNPVEREKAAKEALDQYVKRKSREKQRPEEEVREEVVKETIEHPYRVSFESMPGAPFFRVEQLGGMRVLHINTSHRFYTDVYAVPRNSRAVRAGLEVLLFSLGECELDALGNPDKQTFYAVERAAWSEVLTASLEMLARFVHNTDVSEADAAPEAA